MIGHMSTGFCGIYSIWTLCVCIFSYTLIRILPTKTIHLKCLCIITACKYIAKPQQRNCYSAKEIHRISLNETTVIIPNNKWNEKNLSKRNNNGPEKGCLICSVGGCELMLQAFFFVAPSWL